MPIFIRARRLSKSAVALHLTVRPILDIALQYRFDSQQTFTRAFKKQFSITPALYRRSSDWRAKGIRSPIRLDHFTLPEHQFVTMAPEQLVGITQSYTCSLEQMSTYRNEMHSQFWRTFLENCPEIPSVLYGLNESRPSLEKEDEQEVLYTTALPQEMANDHLHNAQSVALEDGEYVQFNYDGPFDGFQEFILTVYGCCMPALDLTRRKGQDIERFSLQTNGKHQERPHHISCEYLIPVQR